MGHGVVDTSVKSAANKAAQHHQIVPAFEHAAFPVALGFVAGFVDVYGFMGLFGLVLLPRDIDRDKDQVSGDVGRKHKLIMKIAGAANFRRHYSESGRDPLGFQRVPR